MSWCAGVKRPFGSGSYSAFGSSQTANGHGGSAPSASAGPGGAAQGSAVSTLAGGSTPPPGKPLACCLLVSKAASIFAPHTEAAACSFDVRSCKVARGSCEVFGPAAAACCGCWRAGVKVPCKTLLLHVSMVSRERHASILAEKLQDPFMILLTAQQAYGYRLALKTPQQPSCCYIAYCILVETGMIPRLCLHLTSLNTILVKSEVHTHGTLWPAMTLHNRQGLERLIFCDQEQVLTRPPTQYV